MGGEPAERYLPMVDTKMKKKQRIKPTQDKSRGYGRVFNVIDKVADPSANRWYRGPTSYDSSMLSWKDRMEVLEEQPEDWVDAIYP